MTVSLAVLAFACGAILAIGWTLVTNGTVLLRVGTVELPSPSAARFWTVTVDGAPHLVVSGHDPGSMAGRGLARMSRAGGDCHVEVDRVLDNPAQVSGDYIYIFPSEERCVRVTFGKGRIRVAPAKSPWPEPAGTASAGSAEAN